MTNAEKYEEVFGMQPDKSNCPTSDCKICPCANVFENENGISVECRAAQTYEWWNQKYKENDNDV